MCSGKSLRALALCALALGFVLAVALPTWADSISNGQTVTFLNMTPPDGPLGPSTTSADTISFRPQDFSSHSKASGSSTESTLTMTIAANTGRFISEITLANFGDFTLIGSAGTTASASVAGNSVTLNIVSADGSHHTLTPAMAYERDSTPGSSTPTFVASNGVFSLPEGAAGTLWRGGFSLAGLDATEVTLAFNNSLSTDSGAGTEASIRLTGLDIGVTTIPEPATLALLGVGACGLAMLGWRSRRSRGRA